MCEVLKIALMRRRRKLPNLHKTTNELYVVKLSTLYPRSLVLLTYITYCYICIFLILS